MSNVGFYVFVVVAVIVAALVVKHVVTCLMRSLVVVILLVALGLAYWFFVGQYDPEIHDAARDALDAYKASSAK